MLAALLLWLSAPTSPAAERVRVGILKFGTVNWELDVIRTHGLAEREGVDLQIVPLASKRATAVALQGGAVDLVVSDWIWVSRQRAERRAYVFVPYSLAVGAVRTTRPGVSGLRDLQGKKVGVAGGPVDKSWLLLRAHSRRALGEDIADLVEPTFVAPPLLNQLMLRGELPAGLNFWHYGARLEAAGMQEVVRVETILTGLGIEAPVPLLGWVFDEQWGRDNERALNGFLRASYAAKQRLLESDEEWNRLRPMMKAEDDATANALRDAFRAGIPRGFGPAERDAAARVFALLAELGGAELVGSRPELSAGTFWEGFEIPSWSR